MKLLKRHIIFCLIALFSLTAGLLNYIFFHPDIILFHVIHFPSFKHAVIYSVLIHRFFTGYFSDICWCIALCLVTIVLSELNYLDIWGKVLILVVPFVSEAAQMFGFLPGTFDWYDVFTYAAVVFLFVLFSPTLKKTLYEKN
jgi:hypothetical protein